MGVLFALGGAAAWALSSTLLASQVRQVDTLSASALRSASAVLFFIPLVFVVGAEGEFGQMSETDMLQFAATGFLSLTMGESLYAGAVAIIGMTRAFTTVVGLYNITAFGLAALLLGESLSWDVAFGAVLVIAGVYLVSLYGRGGSQRQGAPSVVRRFAMLPRLTVAGRLGWEMSPMRAAIAPVVPIAGGSGASAEAASGSATLTHVTSTASGRIDVRLPVLGKLPSTFAVGMTLAVSAGLIWGASAVWLAEVAEGFDAAAVGLVRLPAAAGLLLVAAMMEQGSSMRRRVVSRRTMWMMAGSGIFAQGVASILFILALVDIGAGQTVVLFSTAPLIALPLGAIFLRENVTVWVAIGSVIAVIGIAFIA